VIGPSQRPLPDKTQRSQETLIPSSVFEPAVPASERPQTHALDRAATGTGNSGYRPTEVQSSLYSNSANHVYTSVSSYFSFRCSYTSIIIIIISPLVQAKYQEEKACDKRHPYRIIIIIIIIIIINTFHGRNNITCNTNCKHRTAATVYTL